MDGSTASLICLQVAECRESGRALSPALDAHAGSCPDCRAVSEVDALFKRYVPQEMPAGASRHLWEKVKPRRPQRQIGWFRYAAAAAILFLFGANLYVRHEETSFEIAMRAAGISPIRRRRLPAEPHSAALASIVLQISGAVMVRRQGEKSWMPLHPADKLAPESTVRVPPRGGLRFAFPDHTEIALQGGTIGTLNSMTDSNKGVNAFYLIHGKAFIHHHGNPLTILTARTAIEAIGTEFSVSHEGETTRVRVFSGAVRVRSLTTQDTVGRAQEFRLVHQSKWVTPFSLKQAEPWERHEVRVAYAQNGKMIETVRKHLRVPHNPPVPLYKVEMHPQETLEQRSSNAASHAGRLEIKQEEDMKQFEDRVRKREEELLKRM